MRKTTLKIIASILLLFLGIYFFLLSDFNPMFKDHEFVSLRKSLEDTQKENLNSIVGMYNKIHSQNKRRQCECEIPITYIGPYRHGRSLTKLIYLRKIEREFTHDDCLKFDLLHADFLHGNVGIKAASKFYFTKTVEQLTEEEKIMFIVMLDNPSLYNPSRRREKVKTKVRLYKTILHTKPAGNSGFAQ